MTQHSYDIVIVGAGIVGASLALALAESTALRICVIERSPKLEKQTEANQRVVALGAVAVGLLKKIGVYDALGESFCHPYQRMLVWDESSSGELMFTADNNQQDSLGSMIDSVHCSVVLQVALACHPKVDVLFDTQLKRLDCGSHRSPFAYLSTSEATLEARLVVGADGANSWVRQQSKIFANHHSYGQQGIVAKILTSEPHQDTAWQRFLGTGPLAILPLANNESSIVWSADSDFANELLEKSESDFEVELEHAIERRLGTVSLKSKRLAFNLKSQKSECYVKPHIALVGDAAHSIHPLAGQGANLGFKDIVSLLALCQRFEQNSGETHLGCLSMLREYQRDRKPDNDQTDAMMSFLYGAYRGDSALWASMRGLGMNMLNSTEAVKRWLAAQAMGL